MPIIPPIHLPSMLVNPPPMINPPFNFVHFGEITRVLQFQVRNCFFLLLHNFFFFSLPTSSCDYSFAIINNKCLENFSFPSKKQSIKKVKFLKINYISLFIYIYYLPYEWMLAGSSAQLTCLCVCVCVCVRTQWNQN